MFAHTFEFTFDWIRVAPVVVEDAWVTASLCIVIAVVDYLEVLQGSPAASTLEDLTLKI